MNQAALGGECHELDRSTDTNSVRGPRFKCEAVRPEMFEEFVYFLKSSVKMGVNSNRTLSTKLSFKPFVRIVEQGNEVSWHVHGSVSVNPHISLQSCLQTESNNATRGVAC